MNDQIYPGAAEICDNEDNNCDGNTDEGLPVILYYEDLDNDGFGSEVTLESCDSLTQGYTQTPGDCDDANDQIYPGASEVIDNGIDENCDGMDNYAGVNEVVLTVGISPNPSVGTVQIQGPWSTFDVSVTDLTGKVIYEKKGHHSADVVSTHGWAPATYFVTVSNHGKMAVAKLMVR